MVDAIAVAASTLMTTVGRSTARVKEIAAASTITGFSRDRHLLPTFPLFFPVFHFIITFSSLTFSSLGPFGLIFFFLFQLQETFGVFSAHDVGVVLTGAIQPHVADVAEGPDAVIHTAG